MQKTLTRRDVENYKAFKSHPDYQNIVNNNENKFILLFNRNIIKIGNYKNLEKKALYDYDRGAFSILKIQKDELIYNKEYDVPCNCEFHHDYIRQSHTTVSKICIKCGEDYEKDVS